MFRIIITVDDLEDIIGNGTGYIVIIDKPNTSRRLQRVDCPHVDKDNFYQKVIVNKESNGSYYWFKEKLHAMKELEAEECLVCKQ